MNWSPSRSAITASCARRVLVAVIAAVMPSPARLCRRTVTRHAHRPDVLRDRHRRARTCAEKVNDTAGDLAAHRTGAPHVVSGKNYFLLGSHTAPVSRKYSIWLKPSPQFPLQIENTGPTSDGGRALLDSLAEGTAPDQGPRTGEIEYHPPARHPDLHRRPQMAQRAPRFYRADGLSYRVAMTGLASGLGCGDDPQYRVESAQSKDFVIWNREPMMHRRFRLEHDATADLIHFAIVSMLA